MEHVRLSELPWLKDHVFPGQVLLPAAAYLLMAVEANEAKSVSRGPAH